MATYIIVAIIAYCLGSISFSVLISKKMAGFDVREKGSGNAGATNVTRVLGKKYGAMTFLLDFLKGYIPILLWKLFAGKYDNFYHSIAFILSLSLVLGHVFSIFLKFKGGKGVATTIGVLTALIPSVTIIGLILWFSVFSMTRFVSLASLSFALSLPLNTYLFAYPKSICQLTYIISVFLFITHYKNIQRLWNGTENRFDKKSK